MTLSHHPDSTTLTVADLVRAQPAAVRVLQRHGIDFCCGGKRPLAEACALAGVPTDLLLDEVTAAGTTVTLTWAALAPAALCEAVMTRFHAPLAAELPRLLAMAERVLLVHGHKDPDRLEALATTVSALSDELQPHVIAEEAGVFALIRGGDFAAATAQVTALEAEHVAVGGLLLQLRHLTDGFTPPPGACGTWRALYQGLAELEAETHEHIHVENNILFPAIAQTSATA